MQRLLLPLAVLVLGGGFGCPGSLRGQTDRPEVVERSFEGNERFSDRVLGTAILTRETECRSVALWPFCALGFSWLSWSEDVHYLNPTVLPQDVARIQLFYLQRGFREAQVDTSLVQRPGGGVEIGFRIEEGRPVLVDRLAILGLENLDDAQEVATDLPIAVGEPLSLLSLNAARDTLLERLRNRGYAHADVLRNYFIPADAPYEAEVTFDAFTGPRARFGPVTVEGNRLLSAPVVERMLPFQEGDLYSRERVFEGQRNLFDLEIIRHADVQTDLGFQPDTIVPVTVRVNEGTLHRVRGGVGFSTAECVTAEGRWSSRNFFGGARRLQIQGRLSNLLNPALNDPLCRQAGSGEYGVLNWLVSADLVLPWISSPRNTLSVGVFAERQSLKDIFVRQAIGLDLSLTRSLDRATPLTLSYRPQYTSLDATKAFFCTTYLVCKQDDIKILERSNWLSPVGASVSRDRADRVLNPTSGYRLLLDLEHAAPWTGSDFGYDRVIAEASWYTQLVSNWVLATRLRGGWIGARPFKDKDIDEEVVHPSRRFYAGGANSVRGFAQNDLGPRSLRIPSSKVVACTPGQVIAAVCDAGKTNADGELVLQDEFRVQPNGGNRLLEGNVELRFPVWGELAQGAAFVDFGQVWTDLEDTVEEAKCEQIRASGLEFTPGMGFRYLTPIGPIRLDVAYRFRSRERLCVVTDEHFPPFEPTGNLVELLPAVEFGEADGFSLRRFQLHLSIGQAF
jgi:outer membrane protein insertion porin family